MMRNSAQPAQAARSLTRRLLASMALPMIVLAIALGVGGAWAIDETVEAVNDRILSAASRAIADSMTIEDGEIALDLSPAIFGMLESNARDNVYYSVRHRGRLLTGYADLPNIAPDNLSDTQRTFGKGSYLGRPIRIVAEARGLPNIEGPVLVEVAETLDAREQSIRRMMIALVLLEVTLIGFAAVLLPLAVRWGLRPVAQVRDDMDSRAASDLTPLPLAGVPAELRDLVRSFNAMLGRLDAAVQNMRRFTADASHQMRTPLSILRTHIDVLRQSTPGSPEAEESIDDIEQASERLRHLLVQLLVLARADSATSQQVQRERVDLNIISETAASERAFQAVRSGVELVFVRQQDSLFAQTHASLAGELISNLIDNAIRYNETGGSVVVSVEVQPDGAAVIVEDDGPGIAPADRERVFTRFTRLDRDNSREGSGLGLPIARSLADAIGAKIILETARSGQGLRASVVFMSDDPARLTVS